ncbi:lebercilin [Anguilla rostrata]|uniref:lebercilin n=1 Tax=Anguilla rostrata TaxID=7938 RepID=UPI0030D3D411
MDPQSIHPAYEDNREAERSRQSRRSSGKCSELSLKSKSDKNREADRGHEDSVAGDRARTRTRDPDRDRVSDCEKDSDRFYSDEYENESPSDRSRSLSPCSPSPSPSSRKTGRANHVSSRRGLHRKGLQRAGSKQPRPGVGSQTKGSSPKDLDLVTKRVLSARLLKINEQRNELSSLQQRLEQLQRENRVLRQLQHRQERALHRFEDTESEVAQLISRHNAETHVLRERLRRTQERERAVDRRLHDADEELRRCRAALQKLRRLADDRQLGEREELARKLAQAQERAQEDERRIKELERNMELSTGSFQRQVTAERRKTHEVQEEVRNLREELERLTQKLKEKERELNTRNIYANRMMKGTPRKDTDSGVKRKGPGIEGSPRCSSKGVQTEEHPAPPDFPTPPPAVADAPEHPRDGGYFSLKEQREDDRALGVTEDERRSAERERERERGGKRQGLQARPELLEEEEEIKDGGRGLKEEGRNGRSPGLFQVQRDPEEKEEEEKSRPANRNPSPEEQRRKEQLLARMREIDREARRSGVAESEAAGSLPEPKSQRPSGPSFPEPVENLHKGLPSQDSSAPQGRPPHSGRRGLNPQGAVDDLSFGSYAPSFGQPAGRAGVPAQRGGGGGGAGGGAEPGGGAEEKPREEPDLTKEKKSNLMQQLFGSAANGNGEASRMEVLSPPAARKAAHPNGGPFPWEAAKKREGLYSFEETPPARRGKSLLQVAESRPAVRAIGSFDEDIEEVTL